MQLAVTFCSSRAQALSHFDSLCARITPAFYACQKACHIRVRASHWSRARSSVQRFRWVIRSRLAALKCLAINTPHSFTLTLMRNRSTRISSNFFMRKWRQRLIRTLYSTKARLHQSAYDNSTGRCGFSDTSPPSNSCNLSKVAARVYVIAKSSLHSSSTVHTLQQREIYVSRQCWNADDSAGI